MAKVSRNRSTGRFSIAANGKDSPSTIRDSQSGTVLALRGYGAMSGEYVVRDGIDLSKPIAAQAADVKPKEKAIAAHKPG
ncbi:hypothetical protein EWE75_03735 [Sphingomonas populi]|uniref:Uncharacterized protein n=1 Tax=Sphingomonas populi TaxID=2484750 RepID=A0A4Q6XZ49_9SPHN|nr:hypothetical protein [Sphingomonas populi]RZF65780.1 hypothetical protein EWE75_03735 [Sphingomonas populi]